MFDWILSCVDSVVETDEMQASIGYPLKVSMKLKFKIHYWFGESLLDFYGHQVFSRCLRAKRIAF